jgi:nitrite reductase (NADH) small subunit
VRWRPIHRIEARTGNSKVASLVKVAKRGDIPDGTGKTVEAGGRKIALFNAGGQFFAVDNACRHRGGPLGEGDLIGTTVVCPWHGWEYDVTNGQSVDDPSVSVACFSVRIQGDDILVEI